jgi:hypothetical protein
MLPGYPASEYLDIPPGLAAYLGQHDLDKGPEGVDIADVFRRNRYELKRDRPHSLSQRLSGSLNCWAAERTARGHL